MNPLLPFEWVLATRFLREGLLQTLFIIAGVALGVSLGVALGVPMSVANEKICGHKIGAIGKQCNIVLLGKLGEQFIHVAGLGIILTADDIEDAVVVSEDIEIDIDSVVVEPTVEEVTEAPTNDSEESHNL